MQRSNGLARALNDFVRPTGRFVPLAELKHLIRGRRAGPLVNLEQRRICVVNLPPGRFVGWPPQATRRILNDYGRSGDPTHSYQSTTLHSASGT